MEKLDNALNEAAGLYNGGNYQACISLFDELLAHYEDDAKTTSYLDMFSALKYRCYYQLKQHDRLLKELTALLEKYQHDYSRSAAIVAGLGEFNLDKVLLDVPATHRFIAGQHYRLAFVLQLHGQLLKYSGVFESFAPMAFEYDVELAITGADTYVFTPAHIKRFTIQNLPNGNTYFELQAQKKEVTISGSIPLPNNDAICESGSITLVHDGKEQTVDIDRTQVEEVAPYGPHAIKLTTPEFMLDIFNTHLAGKHQEHNNE